MDGTALVGMGSASARLPARQREALELHELQGHSYEAIAARLDTSSVCVAQLIGHARINLYDELYGTILASVSPSPDCERALGLIAAREDGELAGPAEGGWLDDHLEGCDRCQRGVEEMSAAAATYRGETAGAGSVEPVEPLDATAAQPAAAAEPVRRQGLPRRRLVTAAAVGLLLGLTGLAAALAGNDKTPSPVEPAADAVTLGANSGRAGDRRSARPGAAAKKRQAAVEKQKQSRSGGAASPASPEAGDGDTAYVPEAAASPASNPTPAPAPSGSGAQGNPGPDPIRPAAGAVVQSPTKPGPRPTPTPSTAPEPAPAPAPELAPSETPTQSHKPAEPPGQSGDHPRK